MAVSNKRLLLALALFAPDEVTSFAIPSLGTPSSIVGSCQQTTSIAHGDDCAAIAKRCNITHDALLKFNSDDGLCSKLRIGDLVCCSKGIQPRTPSSTKKNSHDDSLRANEVSQDAEGEPGDSDDDGQETIPDGQGRDNDEENPKNGGQGAEEDENGPNNDEEGSDDDEEGQGLKGGQGQVSDNDNQDPKGTDDDDNNGGNSSGSNNAPGQEGTSENDTDNNTGDKDAPKPEDDIDSPTHHTGAWSNITCSHLAAQSITNIPPQQRWEQLGAAEAFRDAVAFFKKNNTDGQTSLPSSVIGYFGGDFPFPCQNVKDTTCSATAHCTSFNQNGTGAAAMLIQNSFVSIWKIYNRADSAITDAQTKFQPSMDSFIRDFAPVPPPKEDNKWLDFFLDLATMGAAAGLGKFIKAGVTEFSLLAKATDKVAVKSATESMLRGATDSMKELHNSKTLPEWDTTKQQDLKAMLGSVFASWKEVNSAALSKVFAQDDESIVRLGNLINGGKMISNETDGRNLNNKDITAYVNQFGGQMFATAAPLAWRLSNSMVFIVDMEAKCGADNIDYAKNRIDRDDFQDSSACFEEQLYYLAMVPEGGTQYCPSGKGGNICNSHQGECYDKECTELTFSHPPGIQNLDGKHTTYANITAEDIIKGSLLTYKANGNKNGGGTIDYTKIDTILDLSADKPQVPGMYRLPVCSGQAAYQKWKNGKGTDENYPC